MIAFSIIMWFCSFVICFFSICILKGDTSPMHGKREYETLIEDKAGYVKSFGRIGLFMSAGLLVSGLVCLAGTHGQGILYALVVIFVMTAVSVFWYYRIIHKYRKNGIKGDKNV